VRVALGLLEVLDGDEAAPAAVVIATTSSFSMRCSCSSTLEPFLETNVAPRQNADGLAVTHHRQSIDAMVAHQRDRLGERLLRVDHDGVDDHAGLGALHPLDLARLLLRREVLVDEAEPTAPGHRDGEFSAGDRVHRRADEGNVQPQPAGQARPGVHLVGQDFRVGRQEQHVVESERVADDARRTRGDGWLRHGGLR
jgi:hypothetical protein